METANKYLITNFIEDIWNKNEISKLPEYLHPYYQDHSLPPNLPANAEGLKLWIEGTNKSFEHTSIIDEMVCEKNKIIIKFKMLLKHIGTWRDIEPTGAGVHAIGYRYFKLEDNKIIEHWALIDGNAIENQLREASHGCKIQE